jgi:hypothetical protein
MINIISLPRFGTAIRICKRNVNIFLRYVQYDVLQNQESEMMQQSNQQNKTVDTHQGGELAIRAKQSFLQQSTSD